MLVMSQCDGRDSLHFARTVEAILRCITADYLRLQVVFWTCWNKLALDLRGSNSEGRERSEHEELEVDHLGGALRKVVEVELLNSSLTEK